MTQHGGTPPPDGTSEPASADSSPFAAPPPHHPPATPPPLPPMAGWSAAAPPTAGGPPPGPGHPGGPYPPSATHWQPPASPYPGPAPQPYPAAHLPHPGSGVTPPPPQPGPMTHQPQSGPTAGQPGRGPLSFLKKRGPMVATLVLAVVLLLCGVGGTFSVIVLRKMETGEGPGDPVAAVDSFLRAVYHDRNAKKAAALVCAEARDVDEITKKVDEVEEYRRTYQRPRFQWEAPQVEEQNSDRAIVTAELSMITADEKIAKLPLRFTVVQRTGWLVCEVS